jgi:hypothetical protein
MEIPSEKIGKLRALYEGRSIAKNELSKGAPKLGAVIIIIIIIIIIKHPGLWNHGALCSPAGEGERQRSRV